MLGEDVEFLLDLGAVVVTRFEGVDKDFDGGFVDFLAGSHEHVFVVFEGDAGDHLDILGTLFELDGKRLNGFDADADVPDGLVEGDHGLGSIFRGILVEFIRFGVELADLLLKIGLVED